VYKVTYPSCRQSEFTSTLPFPLAWIPPRPKLPTDLAQPRVLTTYDVEQHTSNIMSNIVTSNSNGCRYTPVYVAGKMKLNTHQIPRAKNSA